MTFKSRKDILFQSIFIVIISFFIGVLLVRVFKDGIANYTFIWADIFLVLLPVFLIWLDIETKYELTQTELIYKSGPVNGKINIDKIKEIIKDKTLWVGLKPATARKGLIIKYGYDEIYISPKTNDTFINEILKLNNRIKITQG